jgi:sugar phosphate isomerase/epimerase
MAAEKLKLGVIVNAYDDPEGSMQKVADLGLPTCQVSWRPLGEKEVAGRVKEAAQARGIEITTWWTHTPGMHSWDFVAGPISIGLVPTSTRFARIRALENGAQIAAELGIPSITTHVGFLPEAPYDPVYLETLHALKEVVTICRSLGVEFWFETGQETPITLLRTIQNLGEEGIGINLDPANLLMYGKGNPVDALDVFGKYVRGLHAKDGEYPTNGDKLGVEKPLGEGRVDFPILMGKLKELGYNGAVTIEREITGDQQIADIKRAMELLDPLL